MNRGSLILACSALLAGCVSPPAGRHEAARTEQARDIVARHSGAIVTVRGTLRVRTQILALGLDKTSEATVEAPGAVVDPSGVVVAGALPLDPVGCLIHSPIRAGAGPNSIDMEVESVLEGLHVLRADGTEVSARVVARDDDIGLMVLAADRGAASAAGPWTAIPLADAGPLPPYSSGFVLARAGGELRHATLIGRGMSGSLLGRPRPVRLWLSTVLSSGMPVFHPDGQLAGFGGMVHRRPGPDRPEPDPGDRPLQVLLPVEAMRRMLADAAGLQPAEAPSDRRRPAPAPPITLMPAPLARTLTAARQASVVSLCGTVSYEDGPAAVRHEDAVDCVVTLVASNGLGVCAGVAPAGDRPFRAERLRYVLPDGDEIPVRLVTHDAQLRLSVVAPADDAPRRTWQAAVPVPGTGAGLFERVLALGRLGPERDRATIAEPGRIIGVLPPPLPCYLADGNLGGREALGAPVFLADGRLLGIFARPSDSDRPCPGASDPMCIGLAQRADTLLIVPADVLVRLVGHALAAGAGKPGP